jgi:hypothetical protein
MLRKATASGYDLISEFCLKRQAVKSYSYTRKERVNALFGVALNCAVRLGMMSVSCAGMCKVFRERKRSAWQGYIRGLDNAYDGAHTMIRYRTSFLWILIYFISDISGSRYTLN